MLPKKELRKRIKGELEQRGMLLIEAQKGCPSIAGLMTGDPEKAGGFSWEAKTAYALARDLAQETDVASIRLFRRKDTLVHQSLWPALASIASFNVAAVKSGVVGAKPKKLYSTVSDSPGFSGMELKAEFEKDGGGGEYGLVLSDLQTMLCIVSETATDGPSTGGEVMVWYHWERGQISRMLGSGTPPPIEDAINTLIDSLPNRSAPTLTLLPCLRLALEDY